MRAAASQDARAPTGKTHRVCAGQRDWRSPDVSHAWGLWAPRADEGPSGLAEASCRFPWHGGGGAVGAADLQFLLAEWGACTPAQECLADLDEDGNVSISDLFMLLANWG